VDTLGKYSSLTEQRAQVAAEGRQIETEAAIAYVVRLRRPHQRQSSGPLRTMWGAAAGLTCNSLGR
jgi:hypothetical protein